MFVYGEVVLIFFWKSLYRVLDESIVEDDDVRKDNTGCES